MGIGGISIWQILTLLILLFVFLLPTYIASKKNHPYKVAIILVNILGGIFWGIGWLIALVWCFIEPKQANNNQAPQITATDDIEKLHELKEKGAITQEEFDSRKKVFTGDIDNATEPRDLEQPAENMKPEERIQFLAGVSKRLFMALSDLRGEPPQVESALFQLASVIDSTSKKYYPDEGSSKKRFCQYLKARIQFPSATRQSWLEGKLR
ncbi:superinfection immunity protein [Solemya velesiana gill symbiont]|uniref:SHOCT domain-containing protein n=1 Tax=Solemya velesiana gill symbiont TaxID=1918948 RepID=A0A1T2KS44_9GAMM|nr:superinfection immunity protein [Solemya velesiana gill symbiont]OOZ35621.1 hypothetical protein BOW51_11125 [Solemya velesiana gill symbiont]